MIHGGDIYRNKIIHDFSVNINPFGMPDSVRKALHDAVDRCIYYPDIRADRLRHAIGEMTGQGMDNILVGNGASELFTAVVNGLNPNRILIPTPSFYGYEWASSGRKVEYYAMREIDGYVLTEDFVDCLTADIDMIFLANPNNPVGHTIEPALLQKIIKKCEENHIYILLDECFIEFCEDYEAKTGRKYIETSPHLMIIGAFTKIFAIPGVRLGYMISGSQQVISVVAGQLPEWNTSVFAQMAGEAAAEETEFLEKSRQYLAEERRFMQCGLKALGLEVYPSEADFILVKTELPLYELLLPQGILVRDCSNFRGLDKGYYRMAIKTREENEELLDQIRRLSWN